MQTYSKHIFACSIPNLKTTSLKSAIGTMIKNKMFKNTRTLLFDGESGLRGKTVQQDIYDKFKIKIHAQPSFKRNMAERAVKEIKLRITLKLNLVKETFTKWRKYLPHVIKSINNKKTYYKNFTDVLNNFYKLNPSILIPQQQSKFFKFKIGDSVFLDINPLIRKSLQFKYSLNPGNIKKILYTV